MALLLRSCFLVCIILAPHTGCSEEQKISDLELALIPVKSAYHISDRAGDAVRFTAWFRNSGDHPVTVAHPLACRSPVFGTPQRTDSDDPLPKAALLLRIERPDGTTIKLREGGITHFEPGNKTHLTIPAGGSESFQVGWFFENARGRWEDDLLAWRVFSRPGKYQVRIRYYNHVPEALLFRPGSSERIRRPVWTGDLSSPPAEVKVR